MSVPGQSARHTPVLDIVQLVRRRAVERPDQRAFSFIVDGQAEPQHQTCGEIDRQARLIASRLQALNAAGERVLLMYPSGLDFVVAFLGCLYAGAIAVPLYPPRANRSLDRFQAVVADANATLALTTSALAARLEESFAEVAVLRGLRLLATDCMPDPGIIRWKEPAIRSDHLAFLQYTSGSTAQPKGVMVSHGNLIHNQQMIQRAFGHDSASTILSWLPLYHDLGLIGSVILPLCVGCPCILMAPTTFLQRPIRWLEAISRYRATASGGPNFAYELCMRKISPAERAGLDLSCWRVAVNGAEPVRAETIRDFSAQFASAGFSASSFYPSYGMAESTLLVTTAGGAAPIMVPFSGQHIAKHVVVPTGAGEAEGRLLVGCGTTVLDQRVVIVDPHTRQRCQDDQVGEIWVAGGSVALGYWQKPELTSERFQARLSDVDDGPFLRTGDLGFLHQGALFITGRLADLIIIRGRNLYPQDIERSVDSCHQACQPCGAAAFTIEHDGEERLVVVQELTRHGSREADGEAVIAAIRQAVAAEHDAEVHAIILLKAGGLPKTSSGKVQRHACRIGYIAGDLPSLASWQRTEQVDVPLQPCTHQSPPGADEIEAWMLGWIGAKIGKPPSSLDATQPFTIFGLDSLAMVEMGASLDAWLGRSTRDVMVFDYPTVRKLAGHLASTPAAEPIAEKAVLPSASTLDGLLAQIERMTDAEAEAAIRLSAASRIPPPHE